MNDAPPGHTEDLAIRRILVLAPHYDDEVLGCGGLIARSVADGAAAQVLFLTDGGGDRRGDERATYVEQRRQEAAAAAEVLGLAGFEAMELPDGRLVDHLDAMGEALEAQILRHRPDHLLVTSPVEASADHRAAFAAVHRRLGALRPGMELWDACQDLTVLTYEVNHPQRADLLVDISEQRETIERAMGCYASQQAQHDYLAASMGLARFRALTLESKETWAEAYRRLTLQDFVSRGPARLLSHLGASPELLRVEEGPTVTVIVRTMNRPELLKEALESLASNTYGRTEVLVVNDGGASPELPDDFPHSLRCLELPERQGRAAAANAGIHAAESDFVAFLDDDDLAEPEHLTTLATLASGQGVRVAYTDAAVGVYHLDGRKGWRCVERRLPYSRDFDPDLLLFDNYIPFNTLLIERALLLDVGELDTSFPFFEDWDLLIRLAAKTPFHHLSQVTCEYRQFRGGGHHVLGDRPREQADFVAMKGRVIEKHRASWTAETAARVVDSLHGEAVAEQESVGRLRQENQDWQERYHRLNGRFVGLETHCQVLEDRDQRAQEDRRELRELREQERQVSEELRGAYSEIERLHGLIEAMEGTRAWRLHRWVEGVKGRR